jgi:hypothetical protein
MFGAIIVLFFLPWLDTSKVRSAVYRPWYKLAYWLFVINAIILGWLGSQPAEGLYTTISQICTLLYFAFFLVAMPVLGLVETPRRVPNSITEAVLEKRNKSARPKRPRHERAARGKHNDEKACCKHSVARRRRLSRERSFCPGGKAGRTPRGGDAALSAEGAEGGRLELRRSVRHTMTRASFSAA